jgi:hypothetical protein
MRDKLVGPTTLHLNIITLGTAIPAPTDVGLNPDEKA